MQRFVAMVALALFSTVPGPVAAAEKPVIAMIGTGTLAGVLGPALGRRGFVVAYGSRDPGREAVRELVARTGASASAADPAAAASRAGIVILAVPSEVLDEVVGSLGELDGRIVVDVSGGRKRVAADGYLELASEISNAERLQSRHPRARVVRINIPLMFFFDDPTLAGARPTVLIAGNDPRAREAVAGMIFELGLDPWDAGPLRFASTFDAMNVMGLVPDQQGRGAGYELRMMPSAPLGCFIDPAVLFGFGRPYDLGELPQFPRRDPLVPCEEWRRRTGWAAPPAP